ncbi:protein S100-A11-like [Pterocles gutturalis]|uniref:protein S100-A9-like n=1 Tax=Pterocles gutturalis TaxID=240206 RepID=UPI0005289150|nr:PREDICTED: protein S100-A9-like [Pterocles gutturalis]
MKTDLELALECVVNIYHQYALKCPPIDDYLNKYEFTMLLKETASPFLHSTMPPSVSIDDYINKLFDKADGNHNGRLKFTEFLKVLTCIAIDAHKRFHQCPGKSLEKQPDAGHSHDHGKDQDPGHGKDQDHGHKPSPGLKPGPVLKPGQDHSHDHGHNPGQDRSKDHGHGPGKDRGHGPGKDHGQSPGKDRGHGPRQ